MVIMATFEQLAVEQAIKKLFSKDYFDITTLDTIGRMLERNPEQHPVYPFLRGLHCVHYSTMPRELVAQLQDKVAACLGAPPFNPARLVAQLTDEGGDFTFTEDRFIDVPKVGRISRLLGRGK